MTHLLSLFDGGRRTSYARGAPVFFQGDDVAMMAYVLAGQITLHRPLPDGGTMVLQRARGGDVLAEASTDAPQYHCAALAQSDADLMQTPITVFRARLAERPELAALWAAHLAQAVQSARLRAEVRSLRGVEARLSAWLASGHHMPPHGQVQDMAVGIGVTCEALYRALAKRRG